MHWHGAFKTFQSWPRSLYGGLLHRAILSGDLNIEILTAHLFIGKICNFTLAAQEKEWMWPISETGYRKSQPKAWTTITTKFHAHCHNCWLVLFVWYIGSEKWPGDQIKIGLDDWVGSRSIFIYSRWSLFPLLQKISWGCSHSHHAGNITGIWWNRECTKARTHLLFRQRPLHQPSSTKGTFIGQE